MHVSNPSAHLWGQGWRTGPLAGFQSVLHQQPLTLLKPNQITPHPAQYPPMASRSEWKPKSLLSSAGLHALCPWRSWLMPHTSPLADSTAAHTGPHSPSHTQALQGCDVHAALCLQRSSPKSARPVPATPHLLQVRILPILPPDAPFLCLIFLFITFTI